MLIQNCCLYEVYIVRYSTEVWKRKSHLTLIEKLSKGDLTTDSTSMAWNFLPTWQQKQTGDWLTIFVSHLLLRREFVVQQNEMRIDEPNIESMKVDYSRHLPFSTEHVELIRFMYKKKRKLDVQSESFFPFFFSWSLLMIRFFYRSLPGEETQKLFNERILSLFFVPFHLQIYPTYVSLSLGLNWINIFNGTKSSLVCQSKMPWSHDSLNEFSLENFFYSFRFFSRHLPTWEISERPRYAERCWIIDRRWNNVLLCKIAKLCKWRNFIHSYAKESNERLEFWLKPILKTFHARWLNDLNCFRVGINLLKATSDVFPFFWLPEVAVSDMLTFSIHPCFQLETFHVVVSFRSLSWHFFRHVRNV